MRIRSSVAGRAYSLPVPDPIHRIRGGGARLPGRQSPTSAAASMQNRPEAETQKIPWVRHTGSADVAPPPPRQLARRFRLLPTRLPGGKGGQAGRARRAPDQHANPILRTMQCAARAEASIRLANEKPLRPTSDCSRLASASRSNSGHRETVPVRETSARQCARSACRRRFEA
jgi:hypothetical protein